MGRLDAEARMAIKVLSARGFARLGGVPATLRVDNEKTAIARGAGLLGIAVVAGPSTGGPDLAA